MSVGDEKNGSANGHARSRLREQQEIAAARLLEAQTRLAESVSLDLSGFGPMPDWALGLWDTPNFYPAPNYAQGLTWMLRQKRGELIPAFLTEPQLSIYRRHIRTLVV